MFPLMASSISVSVGLRVRLRSAVAAMTWPAWQ
jgi:hypothetical protein